MKKIIFTFMLLCMAGLTAFSENVTKESLEKILADKEVDAFERYKSVANAIVRSDLSSEQALNLCQTVMLPFCEHKIEDTEHRNIAFSNTYDCIRMYNGRLGNTAEVLKAIKNGVLYLEQCKDARFRANFFHSFGNDELNVGDRQRAFDYFNRSIIASEEMEGQEQMINVCYYMMAIPFQEMRDYRAMADIIAKMKVVAARAKDETAAHHLYTVQMGYFESQMNVDSIDHAIADSALHYAKKAIRLYEKYGDEIDYTSMPIWSYYNVAVMYHLYVTPTPTDSIEHYLGKAEELNVTNDVEINVSLKDLRAWSYFHKKEYCKAEVAMLETLAIIDANDRNTFLVERCQAYNLMSKIYKEMGDLHKALHYRELHTKVYKERFDSDKNRALHDLTVKYDVEKKVTEIAFLKERNAYAIRINIWGFATAIFLFMALMFGVFIIRLRKRNYEQQIYESAMEAEMSKQELEYIKDGIRPSRVIVSKLIETIQNIPISAKDKTVYMERLSALDFDTIEKQYLVAKTKLSAMDMKYIICFFIDMSVPDISMLFNIEPTSVHTVRYRIKKKFDKADTWCF